MRSRWLLEKERKTLKSERMKEIAQIFDVKSIGCPTVKVKKHIAIDLL